MADARIKRREDFGNEMLQRITSLESKFEIRIGLLQRILLAETGTVEQILSVLTNGSIRVEVIEQEEDARMITRESLIMNKMGKVLIRAKSTISKNNLPPNILTQIKRKELGIGTIIADSGLETFRRIMEVGYDPTSRSVFRKYQITVKKKVAFEIMEEFVGIED